MALTSLSEKLKLSPRHWAGLALVGGWLVFFRQLVFSSWVPFERDFLVTSIPLRQFLRDELAQGHFPHWYPYDMLGVPFIGSVVASPFHPQTLLLALLSPAVATKWSALLAYLLGLVGAYRLCRQLGASRVAAVAGAYVFGFGGLALSYLANPPYLVPLMTAPWAMAAALRIASRDRWRDVAELGLWWALIFLGGDAQLFLECGVLVVGLVALRGLTMRKLVRLGCAGVLAAALAGAELVPALAFADESTRADWKPSPAMARAYALHPVRILDLFVPGAMAGDVGFPLGQLLAGGQVELFIRSFFVGGVALLLAALGLFQRSRMAWGLGVGAVLGLWLATGHVGGLLEVLWQIAPALARFRFPEKYMGITILLLSGLVALGVDQARRLPRRAAWVMAAGGAALGLAHVWARQGTPIAMLFQSFAATESPTGPTGAVLTQALTHGTAQTSVLLLVAAALCLFALKQPRALLLLPALILAELWLAHGHLEFLAPAESVEATGRFAKALRDLTGHTEPPPRVIPGAGQNYPPDMPVAEQLRQFHELLLPDDAGRGGVVPFASNDPANTWRAERTFRGPKAIARPETWWRYNVCFRVLHENEPPQANEHVIAQDDAAGLLLVQGSCQPRAFFSSAEPASTVKEASHKLRGGLPTDVVVWEGGPAKPTAATGTIEWVSASSDRLELEANASADTALVVSDAFASGWNATVDGQPAPIYPTNVALRGLAVPGGHHRVVMTYSAPGFTMGCVLSLVGLITALLLLFRSSAAPAPRKRAV